MTAVTSFENRLCYSYRLRYMHSCLFLWLSLVPLAFSVLSRRGSIFCTRLHVDYMYYVDNDALRKYMLQYRFSFLSANLSS